MTEIVPSYVRKVNRAEKHLVELKEVVDQWRGRHPYTVRTTHQRKRDVHRLVFTEDPANTEIGIITADVVYNLRSALDHLAAALVPATRRDSVYFPIFWQGVWEPSVPGEPEQRGKDRARWNTTTRRMQDGAVAVLKRLQPTEGRKDGEPASALVVLNQLSNTDRHSKLPVFASALRAPAIRWWDADGKEHIGTDHRTLNVETAVENEAEIHTIPKGAVNVEIKGSAVVAVRIANPWLNGGQLTFELPDALDGAVLAVREGAINALIPFLHVRGGSATK